MGNYLTGDEILATRTSLKREDVKVPEWNGVVLVQELTGTELDEYNAAMMLQRDGEMIPDMANMRAKLAARAIINEDGTHPFTELQIGQLGQTSGVALNRVYEVAARLSGIAPASEDAATQNLDADLTDDSSSGSPES